MKLLTNIIYLDNSTTKEYIGNIAEQFFSNCFKEPKTKTITEDLGKYKYTIHLELHKEDEK